MEDVHFKVNRDKEGVSGFTLEGVGNTDAESFCLSFLTAQGKGKGSVTFKDGKIVFNHGGVSIEEANPRYSIYGSHGGGIFSAEVPLDEEKELSDLLNGRGKYAEAQIRVREELAWCKGFTLYAKRD